MDAHTAELFWTLLHRGEVALSVTYAFYTKGRVGGAQVKLEHGESSEERVRREGVPEPAPPVEEEEDGGGEETADAGEQEDEQEDLVAALADELKEHLERTLASDAEQRLVRAGAVGVRVDARRWPELFQQIDFNEQMPPGYAVLRIYCYDFTNGLRPDLLFKKVEVEAESVGGRSIPIEAKFLFTQPEVYRRSARFPFAVRLDRPYRYRVSTAARDGTQDVGEWRERTEWAPVLDVTTGAEAEAPQDGGTEP
jgi:hypothetical protein